jgi:hypothetical protein
VAEVVAQCQMQPKIDFYLHNFDFFLGEIGAIAS